MTIDASRWSAELSSPPRRVARWSANSKLTGLVVEKNFGGRFLVDLLEQVFKAKKTRVPCHVISAAEGKRTRAEPVAALYERGLVHHVGYHTQLEDEQCTFTGAANERSPDVLDATVWALHPFLGMQLGGRDTDGASATKPIAVAYKDPDQAKGVPGGAVPWDEGHKEPKWAAHYPNPPRGWFWW